MRTNRAWVACVIVVAGVVGFFLVTSHARADQAAGQDKTWRWGEMPIPRIAQAPTIDGTIDAGEWSKATLFAPLVSVDPLPGNGLPARTRQWVYMGYTDDALYVAWRQELPETELPIEPKVTDQRDRCEGPDNTVNIWFDTKGTIPNNFNVAGNAASQIYDRRHDDGSGTHWNGNLTYKSRVIEGGWEGELKFPFAEMGLTSAPSPGTRWPGYFYSAWRKGGTRLFSWPYCVWRPAVAGQFVFIGDAPGLRFEKADDAKLAEEAAGVELRTQLFRRTGRAAQSYNESLSNAVDASTGEGATFESFEKIVKDALTGFEKAEKVGEAGEYLVRYEYVKGGNVIASGTQPSYKAAPLELYAKPYYLIAQELEVRAEADNKDAKTVEVSLEPGGQKKKAELKGQQAIVTFTADGMAEGDYVLAAEAKDANEKVIGKATEPLKRPPPPIWWTDKRGLEPKIPPPWTPVKADTKKVEILGRQYDFDNVAVPSQVTTKGKQLLAAPMAFTTSQPWESSKLEIVSQDDEAVTYRSESKSGNVTLRVTSKVEFDGFTYVDLDIRGEGNIEKLDFVIPYKKEHATLFQNYMKAPGPGDFNKGGGPDPNEPNPYKKGKRFVGLMPEKGLQTPPTITAWVGNDHFGMEWSCDSSRGWAMAKPNQAIELIPEGDQLKFVTHLISKPVALSKDKPRHIRFGIVATPTKTILPYMAKARIYDDISVWLMPNDWAGWPCWHAPITDEKRIADWRDNKIKPAHDRGQKALLNGGWNITADHPDWEYWGKEMVAEPLANVSWHNVKQFAACYNSPYKDFLANSFGYNARILQFDGLRFDTVVPSYECKSLVHDCGWTDDDGNLWPSLSNFAARDAWKRIYRVFHGGEVKEGVVYLPVAAGPIMAVHSFCDVHEIGEGFYMHAKNIKEAYPPDMVRAMKNGEPYGLRSQSNLKGSPIWVNERITALLAGNGDPRFGDFRSWRPDYTAQGSPGSNINEAWEWVDRWNAQFLGHWENEQYLKVDKGQKMILSSFHLNRDTQRVLLCVSNYEPEPIENLALKFNFGALGLSSQLYAEDAITSEPVALAEDGSLKLSVYGQRYRLIRIGRDKPQFAAENLGPNILKDAPAELAKSWQAALPLEPNSVYLLTAQMKMDKPMGAGAEKPNANGVLSHFLQPFIAGEDIECQAAKLPAVNMVNDNYPTGPVPYRRSMHYMQQSMQQHWEQTPGWVTLHIPYGTGPAPKNAVLEIRKTGDGEFVLKDLQVRKVK